MNNFDKARQRIDYALRSWVKHQCGDSEPNWYPDTWDLIFQIRDLLKEEVNGTESTDSVG